MFKKTLKRILASVGLYHPSLGIKISSKAKTAMILKYKTPALDTLVETGTQFGITIDLIGSEFEKVFSIELDETHYKHACERYAGNERIVLLHGDSAVEIQTVLSQIMKPAMFWLDAHPTGEITPENSPVMKELEAIFTHNIKKHVILVDDARKFDVRIIARIKELARTHGYSCKIEEGLFIIT